MQEKASAFVYTTEKAWWSFNLADFFSRCKTREQTTSGSTSWKNIFSLHPSKKFGCHKQATVVLLVFSINFLTTILKNQDCGTPLIKSILQPEPNQLMDL